MFKSLQNTALAVLLGATKLNATKGFQINGFANFGVTYTKLKALDAGTNPTTDSDFTISGKKNPHLQSRYRDGTRFLDKTELGLNLYFPMSENIEFRSQLVANGSNVSMSFLNLDWAYVIFNVGENSRITVGRQLAHTWHHSQYLDVEAALTLRYTPDLTDIYGVKSLDGISFTHTMEVGEDGIFSVNTGLGANWFYFKDIDFNIFRSLSPTLVKRDRGGKNQVNTVYVAANYEWNEFFWHSYASFNTVSSNLTQLKDLPFLAFATALIWEGETWLLEAEAGYVRSIEDSDDVDKRTEERLAELLQQVSSGGNSASVESAATSAALGYLSQNVMSYQVLLGYRLSEALFPYVGYAQQILFDNEPTKKIGPYDLTQAPFAQTTGFLHKYLYGYDAINIITGININLSEHVTTKINYFYKEFHNPQYKDGKNVSKTDFKRNGLVEVNNNTLPRDREVNIFSITVGTTF